MRWKCTAVKRLPSILPDLLHCVSRRARSISLSLSVRGSSSHHSDKKLRLNSIKSLTFLTTGARLATIGLLCVIHATVAVPLPSPILLLLDLSMLPLHSSWPWLLVVLCLSFFCHLAVNLPQRLYFLSLICASSSVCVQLPRLCFKPVGLQLVCSPAPVYPQAHLWGGGDHLQPTCKSLHTMRCQMRRFRHVWWKAFVGTQVVQEKHL